MLDCAVIGNQIKELRKRKGLTQKELAEELHVSFQAVSGWERGVAPPDLDNLLRIADLFGILLDDLLRPQKAPLFLGLDGGGTKTELVVTDEVGHVLSRDIREGCNPNDIGYDRMLALLTDAIRGMLVKHPTVRSAFLGIAGITVGDHLARLKGDLGRQLPQLSFQIWNDAANLFAMYENADLAVISGTGSVVLVRQGEGYARLGGWGYLLDKAGSAYDMGRDALCIALEEEEAGEEPSVLTRLLLEKMGTATARQNLGGIYEGGKPYIASLATVVFDAYARGDERAIRIVDQSAQALGKLLNLGVSRYGARPVAIAGGGIFEHHGAVMLEHLRRYTSVTLIVNTLPPVYGACRLARAMAEQPVGEDYFDCFSQTYGGKKI